MATAASPQAKVDLRAAFRQEVKRAGRLQAYGVTCETRWNGKKLLALSGKLDPALTASSIASRARSVSRKQLSPTIAAVDILGT